MGGEPEDKKNQLGREFRREMAPVSAIASIFVLVPLVAMLIVPSFIEEDVKVFGDNEESYLNPIIYIVFILIFTFIILMIAKYFRKEWIKVILLGAFFVTMIYVFYPIFAFVLPLTVSVGVASLISGIITWALWVYPEWYVVDTAGIISSIGVTAIVGISFAPGPIIALMVILAVYDAISVYKTKHMIDLADSVMEFNLPVMLVIPRHFPYSFLEKKGIKEQLESGEERDALFIGLGDIIFPSSLAISLYVFLEEHVNYTEIFGINGVILVVAGVVMGTVLGYFLLMAFVLRGKPQAGLPLLNGGAILGYLIPTLLIYHTTGLGV